MTTPNNQEVRNEFPFIRPKIKAVHLIPFMGLIKYIKELNSLKGLSAYDIVRDIRKNADADSLISLGRKTWPDSLNSKEEAEAQKTEAQNILIVAIHSGYLSGIITGMIAMMNQ